MLTYYLPCHLLGTSQSSSEKTKGVYAPDYATFVEIYGVSKDGSKYSRYRFYLGDNMTNDYNIRPNYHYTLPLTFNKIGNPQTDSRVELVDAILQEPDANSYIVNPLPGDDQRMYCIPVAWRINTFWQNEMDAGHIASSTAYTIMNDNEWSADIIWQSSDQQMIEFYDSKGAITDKDGRVSPIYYGQQALRFKPKKGAEGNVLVGVYRIDQTNADDPTKREYSWSWHLWITDYNPDECRNQNWDGRYKYVLSNGSGEVHHYVGSAWDDENAMYHNKWMMDRNLGALSNFDDSSNNIKRTYGMYYQFGRKDPYTNRTIYKYEISSNTFKTTQIKKFSALIHTINTVTNPHTVGLSDYNSYSYIDDNAYWNIWDDPDWNKQANNGVTTKSFFDPCPPGWRIPDISAFKSQTARSVSEYGGHIIYLNNILGSSECSFLPDSGDLHGYAQARGGNTLLRYSTPYSKYSAYVLWLNETGVGSIYRATGHEGYRGCELNVRPIQE